MDGVCPVSSIQCYNNKHRSLALALVTCYPSYTSAMVTEYLNFDWYIRLDLTIEDVTIKCLYILLRNRDHITIRHQDFNSQLKLMMVSYWIALNLFSWTWTVWTSKIYFYIFYIGQLSRNIHNFSYFSQENSEKYLKLSDKIEDNNLPFLLKWMTVIIFNCLFQKI